MCMIHWVSNGTRRRWTCSFKALRHPPPPTLWQVVCESDFAYQGDMFLLGVLHVDRVTCGGVFDSCWYATSMALCDTWTQARAALTEHARDVATDDVRLYMCVLRTATWRC